MIFAEVVVVFPKCQRDVPIKTQYEDLTSKVPVWMTEVWRTIHLAHLVIGDYADAIQVSVVFLNEDPVKLTRQKDPVKLTRQKVIES